MESIINGSVLYQYLGPYVDGKPEIPEGWVEVGLAHAFNALNEAVIEECQCGVPESDLGLKPLVQE